MSENNTRILFTDLDGTLLNDKKEITPGNQAAVNEALRNAEETRNAEMARLAPGTGGMF